MCPLLNPRAYNLCPRTKEARIEATAIAGQWERAGPSIDDSLLVQKAREEPDAFGELYLRYHRRVYWYLRSRTESDDAAADLTQHVFTHALAGLGRYAAERRHFRPGCSLSRVTQPPITTVGAGRR